MIRRIVRISIPLLVLASLCQDCRKDPAVRPLPDAVVIREPTTGNTTETFKISVHPLGTSGEGSVLFYRWDWDADGTWDTGFSSDNWIRHRFYRAGNHTFRIEMIDGKKQSRLFTDSIAVSQGFSPPQARLVITPPTGNPTVEFLFDGSATRDDEDSTDQLQFRWDPLGDGRWLIPYSSIPFARYKYSQPGTYLPRMQVLDPSGRSSTLVSELVVNMLDTLLQVDFTWSKDSVRAGDTVVFDASPSFYRPDTLQKLTYSWLMPGASWTDPTPDPRMIYVFRSSGTLSVGLKVFNPMSHFFNERIKPVLVFDQNMAPNAFFEVSCPYGNVLTQFYFDAWKTTDDHLAPSSLELRWDFDGDGNWDTPYSKDKTIYHQFSREGTYFPVMEARDDQDLTSRYSRRLIVSPNTHPTSYFRDPRDGRYYGTVKIGNQWWMAQNLNYAIPKKMTPFGTFNPWLCLYEQSDRCEDLGKLYFASGAVDNRWDDEFFKICPTGWHLPSKEDWEDLFAAIGGENQASELRLGGKSDFNALDLGYGSYIFVYTEGVPYPTDTIFTFRETYRSSWFFSTTEAPDPQNLRVDIWMLSIDRATLSLWKGFSRPDIYAPARCIKDD